MDIKLYTVKELRPLLKLSTSQIYALIDEGLLRCYRLTTGRQGAIRVSEEHLQAYLAQAERQEEEEEPLKHLR
ncbi:MAG TPA: helix-turn-helix domain-containing protein [Gemmataceae bacterium]|nr:helix-turn-helix domain-containing protein [Gemmataceae bacterium]